MRRDKVVLVYPASPGERGRPDRPPLGLLTVAAPLVAQGVDVHLLDERVEKEHFDEKLRAALAQGPICVGISSMSGRHIAGALRVSRLVKEHSNIPVVWGGVHASLAPVSTVRHTLVDAIVRDDGEGTFPLLLEALKGGVDLNTIRGIGFKDKNGDAVLTKVADPADLTMLPPIPFHLIDFDRYASQDFWTVGGGLIPMETSRGCPFSCSFCTESVRKKKWRALPPERVISDIRYYIDRYKIRNFTFIDDNLFGDIRRGERIVELLVEQQLGIHWYTNIRTDYMANVGQGFLRMLEKSGCRVLTFGAETGSERILDMVHKHATPHDVRRTNRNLRHVDITPHYVTIRGFPTETKKDVAKTLLLLANLLLENRKAICDSPFLIPTPGTRIFEQCFVDTKRDLTLEEWSEIFDLEDKGCPPWLEPSVFAFIQRTRGLTQLMNRTNRHTTPRLLNFRYRCLLRWMWPLLKFRTL